MPESSGRRRRPSAALCAARTSYTAPEPTQAGERSPLWSRIRPGVRREGRDTARFHAAVPLSERDGERRVLRSLPARATPSGQTGRTDRHGLPRRLTARESTSIRTPVSPRTSTRGTLGRSWLRSRDSRRGSTCSLRRWCEGLGRCRGQSSKQLIRHPSGSRPLEQLRHHDSQWGSPHPPGLSKFADPNGLMAAVTAPSRDHKAVGSIVVHNHGSDRRPGSGDVADRQG